MAEWVAGANPAFTRVELAAVLLGGQVGGVSSSHYWLGATTQSILEGDAPFLNVAEYLQEVMPQRMRRLWGDQNPQSAKVDLGKVLPEGFPIPTHRVEVVIPLVPGRRSRSPDW